MQSRVSRVPSISDFVEALGMADIGQAEVVLLGPEERHHVEWLAPPQHVARRDLPLALGDDPVLDADRLAAEPVRPARDVARCVDAGDARRQVPVDADATVDGEARLLRERDRRPNADADDDQIGASVSPFASVTRALVDRRRRSSRDER